MSTAVGVNFGWQLDDEFHGRAWPIPQPSLALPLTMSDLSMHVNAWRVMVDPESECQVAYQSDFQEEVEALQTVCGDCSLQTVELDGLRGDWVIAAYPYGD